MSHPSRRAIVAAIPAASLPVAAGAATMPKATERAASPFWRAHAVYNAAVAHWMSPGIENDDDAMTAAGEAVGVAAVALLSVKATTPAEALALLEALHYREHVCQGSLESRARPVTHRPVTAELAHDWSACDVAFYEGAIRALRAATGAPA